MEARYNVTGTARKALVKAIESIIHQTSVYKKAPTFEYAVGDFTINKNGMVSCDDADALERLVHCLIADGFRPEKAMPETPAQDGEPEAPTQAEESKAIGLTVEIPFDKVNVGNLTKLLDAKGDLIKKALGIDDIRIEMKEDRVAFPWFAEVEPDAARAYTNFIAALCRMSKEAKRVTATQQEVENEKYAFLLRCSPHRESSARSSPDRCLQRAHRETSSVSRRRQTTTAPRWSRTAQGPAPVPLLRRLDSSIPRTSSVSSSGSSSFSVSFLFL